MKQHIIDKMQEIVEETMTNFKNDFYEHDLKELADYDGPFIWQISPTHTHLHRCGNEYLDKLLQIEAVLYSCCQGISGTDCCLEYNDSQEKIYCYEPKIGVLTVLAKRDRNYAKDMWNKAKEDALKRWCAYNKKELPTDFKVRIAFVSPDVRKYFIEQAHYAFQHNDDSLLDCVRRFRRYTKKGMHHRIVICKDFSNRSFMFYEDFGDGRYGIYGGIIFHGYPEEGYRENSSVQLTPSYGWSIHT